MNFDDYIRQFEQWRRIADFGSLARELEYRQRLMEPALFQISREAEQRARLLTTELTQPLRQLTEQLEQQRRLLQPALREFAREAALQQEVMSSATEHLNRAFADQQLLARSIGEQFAPTKELLRGLATWSDELRSQADQVSRIQSEFRQLLQTSASPTFKFIGSHFERTVVDVEQFAEFRETFAAQVLDHLGRIQGAEDADEARALVEELSQFFLQAVDKLPKTALSLEGFLQIFLAIVFFVWSHLASMRTEERVLRELGAVEERIASELQEIREGEQQARSHIVTSAVRLRAAPSTEAATLAILQPNMAVDVKSSQGEWLLVEYFDFVEGEPKRGWVFREYLIAPEVAPYQVRSPRLAHPEQASDFVKEVLEDERDAGL